MSFFCVTSALAQNPIDTEESILIGGIRQTVSIKSEDDSLPLLLFLHGGPGGSVMAYAEKFSHRLQKHFVVVHWDQRETGKTLLQNPSPSPLTLEVFKTDTEALIQALLKRFHHPKLYVVGHSWGTVLGFHMARKHPDLLYAYVAVGPMINQLESERIALAMIKEKALKTNHKTAIHELNTIKVPFENGEQLYFHRKWLFDYNGSQRKLSKSYVVNWSSTWLRIYNEASKDDLFKSLPAIQCPVYFFAGRKDYQTSSGITEAYFRTVSASKKNLFWFERSGHSVPTTEASLFQTIIIDTILPETYSSVPKSKVVIRD